MWQCVREEKMSSVTERLREIMFACACLNQPVCREGARLKSAEVRVIACLYEEDTVFVCVCESAKVMVWEFACTVSVKA